MKDTLSDFTQLLNPSYQPESFRPYLTMILTIVVVTMITYSFQVITNNLYMFANNPISFHSNILFTTNCNVFSESSEKSICKGVTNYNNAANNYRSEVFSSFEQDLHNAIK